MSDDRAMQLTQLRAERANDAAMPVEEACGSIGDNDQAFTRLRFGQKDPKLYYLEGFPLTESLERDPRYGLICKNRFPASRVVGVTGGVTTAPLQEDGGGDDTQSTSKSGA